MTKLSQDLRTALLIARVGRDCPNVLIADDNSRAADKGVFLLHFGAYGCTHVLAFGSLEDALEDAAGVLPKDCFVEPEYLVEVVERFPSGGVDLDERENLRLDALQDEAEADLTYTESGWLASWEWSCTELDIDTALDACRALK